MRHEFIATCEFGEGSWPGLRTKFNITTVAQASANQGGTGVSPVNRVDQIREAAFYQPAAYSGAAGVVQVKIMTITHLDRAGVACGL